jgi:signal transduction histidine kinase
LYRRNGDSFLANLRVLPIAANGSLHNILVILHDQSEQEEYKTRNQMLEQRATLADITASFAHEVRNPINNISTGLQLLALTLPSEDPNQENIGRLQNDCERLADLVKSGLSFVRPVEYKLEPVDLGRLISNLIDRWRNRLTRTQVKYNPQIEDNLPAVEGDLRALEQVFTNLVDNAIQAMEPAGGILTINIRHIAEIEGRSHVEVNILDTGPGIPPEAREHIFEPFYTTKRSGTGLGLAIVKRIVTAHKGSIHVHTIPGGTMFRVRIPCG